MGTWGSGNFDNDGAMDFLGSLTRSLVERAEECFVAGAYLDELGEEKLMPSVELLALLAEEYHSISVAVEVVESWKQRYLQVFDSQMGDLGPSPGYEQERRAVIVATFERLLAVART